MKRSNVLDKDNEERELELDELDKVAGGVDYFRPITSNEPTFSDAQIIIDPIEETNFFKSTEIQPGEIGTLKVYGYDNEPEFTDVTKVSSPYKDVVKLK